MTQEKTYTELEYRQYMNVINKEVRNKIADRTPVRSGRAKRGWEGRYLGGNRIHSTVDNKVPYVPYLEQGHSRQAPNGFMKQGIDAGMASAERIIKEIERLQK